MIPLFCLALLLPVDVEPDVSLTDLCAFPPHNVCTVRAEFAQAHVDWVWDRQRYWHDTAPASAVEAYYEVWEVEACYRRDAWRLLASAKDETVADTVRLNQLRELRASIGRAAYFRGEMPDVVPLIRFQEWD